MRTDEMLKVQDAHDQLRAEIKRLRAALQEAEEERDAARLALTEFIRAVAQEDMARAMSPS